jgi:thioredoxin reductase
MHDVIVVGGGIAGLSAALVLGRARRDVMVLDAGHPRNEPAAAAHGFVTRDGTPPLELVRIAREELAEYPNVKIRDGLASHVSNDGSSFSLTLDGGEDLAARKLVLASGVNDTLPGVPGLAELWGKGVYHCPYCHAWEVRERPLAVLGSANAFLRVALLRGWRGQLSLLTNGEPIDPAETAKIEALAVSVDERAIARFVRSGTEKDVAVVFEDGSEAIVAGVFVATDQEQRSGLPEELGCALAPMPPMNSRFVVVDPVSGETTVPGVYAAGDMTGPMQSLVLAAASGARAAYRLNHALAVEDAERSLASAT